MKLSELTTENAIDVLCQITPCIANIAGDKALLDELREKIGPDKKSVAEIYVYGANKISNIISVILNTHRNDVFGILSAINEMSIKDIEGQNILKTMGQIKECIFDKDLIDFFKSWQRGEME